MWLAVRLFSSKGCHFKSLQHTKYFRLELSRPSVWGMTAVDDYLHFTLQKISKKCSLNFGWTSGQYFPISKHSSMWFHLSNSMAMRWLYAPQIDLSFPFQDAFLSNDRGSYKKVLRNIRQAKTLNWVPSLRQAAPKKFQCLTRHLCSRTPWNRNYTTLVRWNGLGGTTAINIALRRLYSMGVLSVLLWVRSW